VQYFPPFRFDEVSGFLWRGSEPVPLTKKAAQLLGCLLAQPGALVPHDLIMQVVWPDAHVQHENVKTLIHELRTSIGDSAHAPAFIRSYPGRGYAFVAGVTRVPPPFAGADRTPLVGRERELALLQECLAAAIGACQPHVALVEGDRGSGKTTVCDTFVSLAKSHMVLRVSRGASLESPAGAPPAIAAAIGLLDAQYPSLLVPHRARTAALDDGAAQISLLGLRPDDEIERWRLPQAGLGTPDDVAALLEDATRDLPLVVILEDLQWADHATLACLATLAHRRSSAPLCLVGTYTKAHGGRAVDALERLGRELRPARRGRLVRLLPLDAAHVHAYVERQLGRDAADAIAEAAFDATGGHPGRLVRAIDVATDMAARADAGAGCWRGDHLALAIAAMTAESVQGQIDDLTSDDRILLETAAIIGPSFSAAAVAAGLDLMHVSVVTARLDALAARGTLIEACPPRRGAPAGRYRFRRPAAIDRLVTPIPLARCAGVIARASRVTPASSGRG
jgi:DNA-binding winged helix-turn-helix (wHTH) protein